MIQGITITNSPFWTINPEGCDNLVVDGVTIYNPWAGDDMDCILDTFNKINYSNNKPHLIISRTTKGKGVSYMENIPKWHHGVPSAEECEKAVSEITARINTLNK